MRAEEPDREQNQIQAPAGQSGAGEDDRDSIWSIPLARRALYFGLFTLYAFAGIGFLLWYEVFENTADTWPGTIHAITQGIGVTTVGAAGLALLTIEGPQTLMVVADYLRKKLIEPLEEKRRVEAERRRAEAEQREQMARAEGAARNQAEWVAWNERRMAAEASGEPFDEPPPGSTASDSQ